MMGRGSGGAAALAVALLVLAGCVGGSDSSTRVGQDEDGGSVRQSTVDEAPPEVQVSNQTGGIQGKVVNGEGVPIAKAHVSLLSTNQFAKSDSRGQFAFSRLPPGEYTMRVAAEAYRPLEHAVTVQANRATVVEVTIVPTVDAGAGYREHFHDLWGDRTEIALFDDTIEWPWSFASGGQQEVWVCANAPSVTVSVKVQGTPSCYVLEVPVPDGVLVPPGTDRIEATVTWPNTEYVKAVVFRYIPANETKLYAAAVASGETLTVPVQYPMNDHGHARFTLWTFDMLVYFEVAPGVVVNNGDLIRRMAGAFDVRVVAFRGAELPAEPPHPKYWENGNAVLVVDEVRQFGGGGRTSSSMPRDPASTYCPVNSACFLAPPGQIVPPGTTQVNVTLEYAFGGPGSSLAKDKTMVFRAANVNPVSATFDDLLMPQPTREPGRLTWKIPIDALSTDAFYQQKRLWMFLLGHEGEERESEMEFECPQICTFDFHLVVEAYNADWRPDYYGPAGAP